MFFVLNFMLAKIMIFDISHTILFAKYSESFGIVLYAVFISALWNIRIDCCAARKKLSGQKFKFSENVVILPVEFNRHIIK